MLKLPLDKDHFPRIYTIHSQKGGVGKTSISLALAGIFGAIGKKTLLIDADMTGASVADIPGIRTATDKPSIMLNKLILENPNKFFEITSTAPKKNENDKIVFSDKFCNSISGFKNVLYIPSSAHPQDVTKIVPLTAQEDHLHFFRHRMEDIIAVCIYAGFKAIIIDHSPGLFGFSKTSLKMSLDWNIEEDWSNTRLGYLLKRFKENTNDFKPTVQSIIISSFEPHDYRSVIKSLEYVIWEVARNMKIDITSSANNISKSFRLIFNKAPKEIDQILGISKVFDDISGIDELLSKIIEKHEKESGPQLFPFIDGFDMGDILGKAFASIKSESENKFSGEWGRWFKALLYRSQMVKFRGTTFSG